MNLRKCMATLGAAAVLGSIVALPATAAHAAPNAAPPAVAAKKPGVYHPLSFTGTDQSGNTVQGQITKLRTYVDDGQLMAVGAVSTTDPTTGQLVSVPFTTQVTNVTTTGAGAAADGMSAAQVQIPDGCTILHLELAPLQLDVLGLVVTLPNPLVVDITAVPGAGNLLGNLLCSVAGLLDGGGLLGNALNGITALLNRLLAGLGL